MVVAIWPNMETLHCAAQNTQKLSPICAMHRVRHIIACITCWMRIMYLLILALQNTCLNCLFVLLCMLRLSFHLDNTHNLNGVAVLNLLARFYFGFRFLPSYVPWTWKPTTKVQLIFPSALPGVLQRQPLIHCHHAK